MLDVSEVKNGRIYSVVFAGPVSMNKGGRMGVLSNPMLDLNISKRTVMSLQACSRESYVRRMRAQNPDWQPDTSKVSNYGPTENPCVDVAPNGEAVLRAWACGVTKHEVFVNGKPATADQLATIAAYQPGGKFYPTSKPKGSPGFMRLPLAKIEHEGWTD